MERSDIVLEEKPIPGGGVSNTYKIKIPDHAKSTAASTTDVEWAFVTCPIQVQALRNYLIVWDSSPTEVQGDACTRLWRRMASVNGKLVCQNSAVGKHPLSNIGKRLASMLKLPNFNKYTGHWARRTSITLMAEAGLTLTQIKALSGHRSDSVVQGYIARSSRMKRICANALSANPVDDPEEPDKRICVESAAVIPSGRQHIINISGGTIHFH